MDFLFDDSDDEETVKETKEERTARIAQEEASREAQRLRRNEEMERGRQERLAKKKAEEERWYPKQQRVLELEDYFNQHSMLLVENDKKEFLDFLPEIVKLLKNDANMMKRMEAVKDQQGLESVLSTWYNRLDLKENEMERLNDWLDKFEKQVMGALRQRINIKSDNTSQRIFDFFENLKEKAFRRRMRDISAHEIQKKIQEKRQKKMDVATVETRRAFASLNISALPDELMSGLAEQSYNVIEAQRQGPSSEPIQMRLSGALREGMVRQLADHFVTMNLSEPNQVDSDDEDDEVQEVMELEEEIPDVIDWTRALPENPQKSVNFYKATESQREEHRRKKYLDKNARSVHFVDYKSPKNRMRIFMKPNGYIGQHDDDSPITHFVDLSLNEGRKIMEQKPRPHVVYEFYFPDQIEPKYFGRTKLAVFRNLDWLQGYSGNLLGRFWIIRKDYDETDNQQKTQHFLRCIHGLLHDYSENDMHELYEHLLESEYRHMRRSNRRCTMPISGKQYKRKCDPINGVLLMTDWRLLFLEKDALLNASVRYMPTNVGDVFFDSMTAYLIELINDPNIEIHTIIFAFGGSPMFNKEAFKRFWQKLIKETLKSIDVVWTAQDWLDVVESTKEERAHLADFNNYVKKIFEIMSATGHSNYKFCNIREKYKIPIKNLELELDKNGDPDVSPLQPLYFAYFDWFSSVCDFYCQGVYFTFNERKNINYTENYARFPRSRDIAPEAVRE